MALVPPATAGGGNTLWFGDLDQSWDEQYIMTYVFGYQLPGLLNLKLIRDKASGLSMGYGFLEFDSFQSAKIIFDSLNGKEIPNFPGRYFRMNWGERKNEKSTDDFPIYVGDLSPEVTDQNLFEAFKQRYSSCIGARIVTEHSTGAAAGYGFVRFSDYSESVRAITEMKGYILCGKAVKTSQAQTKKPQTNPSAPQMMQNPGMQQQQQQQLQQQQLQPAPETEYDPTNLTVFVGNFEPTTTEDQLLKLFSQFGTISNIRMPPGKCIAFLLFSDHALAANAIQYMNGTYLGSRPLRVSWGRRGVSSAQIGTAPPTQNPTQMLYYQQQQQALMAQQAAQWQMWQAQMMAYPQMYPYGPSSEHQQPQEVQVPSYTPDFSQPYNFRYANDKYLQRGNRQFQPSPVIKTITQPFILT